jgi:actin-related protein 3
MGYAGNNDPAFIVPTAISTKETQQSSSKSAAGPANKRGIDDLDYYIGDEAMQNAKTYALSYPVRHGQVESWDLMEKYHQACIFQYLRCEPEDHCFLLVVPSNTDRAATECTRK